MSVLIADDQSLIRAGFAMVINSQPDMRVVGEAADGKVAVSMTRQLKPDVVLMDVRMPIEDGISATAEITAMDSTENLHTRVIILTTFDLDEYVMNAIRAGASGFLLKDTSPEDMLSSIRTVYRGNAIIAPSATKRLIEKLIVPVANQQQTQQDWNGAFSTNTGTRDPQSARGTTSSQTAAGTDSQLSGGGENRTISSPELDSLTEREREVLLEIAHGLSNQEIADKLFVSLPTVKTHVAHLLAKINARDRVQAVVFAYEVGLVD
ncbi:MAG: response regulator transcription factor [Bifidobacteriaceae bacterium]|nr:response regulator transcription factor [Bifidobacteriaceae bacterium]MCI1978196.1 response regulator transcription factor [Bifidobacteriaceae bacterium]